MKRTLSFVLALLLLLGICLPVMGEDIAGPREGWHDYFAPQLETLLNEPKYAIVRGTVTRYGDMGNYQVAWFDIAESIRGDLSGEIPIFYPRDFDPNMALLMTGSLQWVGMQVNKEYIMVIDRLGGGSTTPYNVPDVNEDGTLANGFVDSCYHLFYIAYNGELRSGCPDLQAEIEARAEIHSLDELEAFFRANLPEDTGWQKTLLLTGGVAVVLVWLALMGWALYKRKKDAA